MSRWIRFSTLCALLGLGLCLGASQAKADVVSLNTSPGLPAAGTPDTNGYTAAFFTNAAINALTTFPVGLVGGAPAPTASGLPAGTTAFTPVVVGPNGTFPIPPWLNNTAASSWIGPGPHGNSAGSGLPAPINGFSSADSSPQGYYYYDKSFTLTSLSGVSLQGGLWATDNNGISIYLNGHNEGNVTPSNGFISFSSFTVNPADFVLGVNHIDFVVFNENFTPVHSSPTGLDVQGTVVSVPEPSTMAIAALGAIGFVGYGLRRRKARVA
jgi:hypothetical protein